MPGVVADYVMVQEHLTRLEGNMHALGNVFRAGLDNFLSRGLQMSDTFVHAGDRYTYAQDFAETRDAIHSVGQQIQQARDAMGDVRSLGDMAAQFRARPAHWLQADVEAMEQAAQDVATRAKEVTVNVRAVAQQGQTLASPAAGAVESGAASAPSGVPAAASSLESAVTQGAQAIRGAASQASQALQSAVTQGGQAIEGAVVEGTAAIEENPAVVPAAGAAVTAAVQTAAASTAAPTAAAAAGGAATAGAAEAGTALVAGAGVAEAGAAGAGAAGAGSTLFGGSLFGPLGLLAAAAVLAGGIWFATSRGSSTPATNSVATQPSGAAPAAAGSSGHPALGTTGSSGSPVAGTSGQAQPPPADTSLAWAGQYTLSFGSGTSCDTIPVPTRGLTLSASGSPDAFSAALGAAGGSINATGSMTPDYAFSADGTTDLDGPLTAHVGGHFSTNGQLIVIRNGTLALTYTPSSNSGGAPQSCTLNFTGTKTGT